MGNLQESPIFDGKNQLHYIRIQSYLLKGSGTGVYNLLLFGGLNIFSDSGHESIGYKGLYYPILMGIIPSGNLLHNH